MRQGQADFGRGISSRLMTRHGCQRPQWSSTLTITRNHDARNEGGYHDGSAGFFPPRGRRCHDCARKEELSQSGALLAGKKMAPSYVSDDGVARLRILSSADIIARALSRTGRQRGTAPVLKFIRHAMCHPAASMRMPESSHELMTDGKFRPRSRMYEDGALAGIIFDSRRRQTARLADIEAEQHGLEDYK